MKAVLSPRWDRTKALPTVSRLSKVSLHRKQALSRTPYPFLEADGGQGKGKGWSRRSGRRGGRGGRGAGICKLTNKNNSTETLLSDHVFPVMCEALGGSGENLVWKLFLNEIKCILHLAPLKKYECNIYSVNVVAWFFQKHMFKSNFWNVWMYHCLELCVAIKMKLRWNDLY